jgi:hypothetical protein
MEVLFMRRRTRLLALLGGVLVLIGGMAVLTPSSVIRAKAFDPNKAPKVQQRLLSQAADNALGFRAVTPNASSGLSNYIPGGKSAPSCPTTLGDNVKVNQNCLNITAPNLQGRGQAQNETAIAINPLNSKQLIAAENDYIRGDGLCGLQYSRDGGKTWQESAVPNEFVRGSDFTGNTTARMYWQGGCDPTVAWDSRGDAYLADGLFNRGSGVSDNPDDSSSVYVYRSVGNGGASWSFPGTPVITSFLPTTPDSGLPLIDKQYMAIDNNPESKFRDRIYVTWTLFDTDGTAYIYEASSGDFARSFSSPVLVSENSSLCPNDYSQFGVVPKNGNKCDENQFSDPFVGRDGALYVAYNNFNTTAATNTAAGTDNRTQVLLSKSTDGGLTFGAPVQVGFYYDLPDCSTYQGQDEFRACVPEQGSQQHSIFRASNYPSGGADPANNDHVIITYGSYINQDSNETTSGNGSTGCAPNGTDPDVFAQLYSGVKTPACANKILVSESWNEGNSFSATGADPRTVAIVPQQAAQAHTDQWFQWFGFDKDGRAVTSYYDRQYGTDITDGSNDITLSSQVKGSSALNFNSVRVTTSSMPNPTQFPNAQGNSTFFGDYSGLAVWDTAHPLWADTRSTDLFDCPNSSPPALCLLSLPNGQIANDEDVFTATVDF